MIIEGSAASLGFTVLAACFMPSSSPRGHSVPFAFSFETWPFLSRSSSTVKPLAHHCFVAPFCICLTPSILLHPAVDRPYKKTKLNPPRLKSTYAWTWTMPVHELAAVSSSWQMSFTLSYPAASIRQAWKGKAAIPLQLVERVFQDCTTNQKLIYTCWFQEDIHGENCGWSVLSMGTCWNGLLCLPSCKTMERTERWYVIMTFNSHPGEEKIIFT